VKEKLLESFQQLVDSVAGAAPKVLTGIVLFLAALVLAKVVEVILRMMLVRLRFDSVVSRAGVDKILQKIGLRQQLNQFIPRLVYFLLLFLLARMVADTLGLEAISQALTSFFAYLPNIVAALLLVILGSAAGQFVGRTVTQAAESAGIDFAPSLGRMVSGLILFVVGIMAITQLKIDTDIIRIVTSFLLAGGALAFGLSFGLGTQAITRNVIAGFYARKLLEVGKKVTVEGQEGVLKAITPTHTIIETDGQDVSFANDFILDKVARQ
jgi:hypothetical protein